jgi:hypothetical protein
MIRMLKSDKLPWLTKRESEIVTHQLDRWSRQSIAQSRRIEKVELEFQTEIISDSTIELEAREAKETTISSYDKTIFRIEWSKRIRGRVFNGDTALAHWVMEKKIATRISDVKDGRRREEFAS